MIMPKGDENVWPKGEIEFKSVFMRYRPNCDLVLKGLSFKIQAGQKVGIVGRTGAGKSTLSMALTRIVELESGQILIDGLNISDLALFDIRNKITIIPQDPTIFQGSLRHNIDPTGQYKDEQIIKLLKKANLQSVLNRQTQKNEDKRKKKNMKPQPPKSELDFEMEENGKNLSSGEKQLICICRAILRQNKIILMDEATANIDISTEQVIQNLIKQEFAQCTVITIAHRLQTIIESDVILVLGNG